MLINTTVFIHSLHQFHKHTTMESIYIYLAIPIVLILLFKKQRNWAKTRLQPPGPKGLPIIGNLHQFDAVYPHTYLYRLSQKYGPIFSLSLGARKVVVISSSNGVKEIMKFHDLTFSGRPLVSGLKKLSYDLLDVVSLSYCDLWRERRKLCTLHLFSLKQLQFFRPIREQEVSRMINKIAEDAALSKVSDLSELTITLTSNIICRMALGKTYGKESESGEDRFSQLFKDTQAMMGGFFVKDYLPALGWIDKISGIEKRLENNFKELDDFYQEVIDEHLGPNKSKTMEGDVIDILLGMIRDGAPDLTIDHIKALLMNILTGGTDTSAAVSVWAIAALMKNPTLMKKVQAEIREVGGKKDFIDEDDIAKLTYFKAVVKETFRLYPPGPLLAPRETMQKCNVQGYEIESGTMIYLNAWAIGRDPENWKDPEEFIPERFLESGRDIKGLDPEVIPFGIGRRGCPAMTTGLAMVELALANLLHSFDWYFPTGVEKEDLDFDALPGLTMHKKIPLRLVAKRVQG